MGFCVLVGAGEHTFVVGVVCTPAAEQLEALQTTTQQQQTFPFLPVFFKHSLDHYVHGVPPAEQVPPAAASLAAGTLAVYPQPLTPRSTLRQQRPHSLRQLCRCVAGCALLPHVWQEALR